MRLPDEWTVFPLHKFASDVRDPIRKNKRACGCGDPRCAMGGKHPAIKWGDLPSGAQEVWKDHGIGLATGVRSGVVVIDLDFKPVQGVNGLESLALLGFVPDTLTVATPSGGFHLYFRHPGATIKNSASAIGPGIDVRGDGGYVVLPDSEHDSGGRYEFLNWPADTERPPIAELPEWLLARLVRSPGADNAPFRFPFLLSLVA